MDMLFQGASMATNIIIYLAVAIALITFGIGWFVGTRIRDRKMRDIEQQAEKRAIKLAKQEDRDRKTAFLEIKNSWYEEKAEIEKSFDEKQRALDRRNDELHEQEGRLTKQAEVASQREKTLTRREQEGNQKAVRLEKRELELTDILDQQRAQLERISGMNADRAREMLLENIRNSLQQTAANIGREIIDHARERAHREAKKILAQAIERCSTDQTVQSSISVVTLPDDHIKGRIVGKEGRNIIAFEAATGVKVIVNDTPEAVVLSSFDPVKRDVARLSMEQLVRDGRINPSRVEAVVANCEKKIYSLIAEEGRQAVRELGIESLHPELVKLVGKLKYRTSYGQSVLGHSKEVAFLAGAMAAELGMDEKLARRCGLLHDIGKAVDQELEGKHTDIGAHLAGKYGEGKEVINGIFYHHGEAEATTPLSFLVKAADAISSSRPGARRDDAEGYIKRVRDLEEVAQSFDGVRDAYAINAGREVRVLVNAGHVNDEHAKNLSFAIAERIREEMTYPGEVQITVIRQTIATNWAGRSGKRIPRSRGRRYGRRGRNSNYRSGTSTQASA